mgnify:CR=1 FL=1
MKKHRTIETMAAIAMAILITSVLPPGVTLESIDQTDDTGGYDDSYQRYRPVYQGTGSVYQSGYPSLSTYDIPRSPGLNSYAYGVIPTETYIWGGQPVDTARYGYRIGRPEYIDSVAPQTAEQMCRATCINRGEEPSQCQQWCRI